MSKRREYEEQVRAKLAKLEAEVDAIKKDIEAAESELTSEHHSKLEKVSELSDRVGDKLEELAEAGEDSWEHLQEGIEHYYQALGNEVKSFNKL